MIRVTLPDGAKKDFDRPISGLDFAASISKSLAKKAVAMKVDGQMWDLSRDIETDAAIEIVTADSQDGVELLRHDAAHVMAQAVQELFPGTQVTIGPVIENGFYYDFARNEPFHESDLEKIEARMREIVDRNLEIRREVWDRDEAIAHFKEIGEHYKAEIIADLPAEEPITIYRQGDWLDLCRGPHLPATGRLGKAFKLTKLAGAYWRGDAKNAQLQRIYGTAWASEKDLKAYLTMLEEAEKRDHRKLGREMDLFHMQEEGPGAVFWHPHGWTIFQLLQNYVRRKQAPHDYREISTPEVLDYALWERSGHAEKFGENMFTTETPDGRKFALKPMNCPGHIQVFNQGLRSYRELPLRLSEFGNVHRYEPSGALHGLLRVRHFCQDDAHIFCTEDQITDESVKVTRLILDIYKDFGFDQVRVKFADRPPVRVGADEVWDEAEAALKRAAEAAAVEVEYNPGEGAFYGPKLEFVLRDAIGRDWQCGTLQVDLNLPGRLGAAFVAEERAKHVPVMLPRGRFGSRERFVGILIEQYAGKFPLWLAPVQIVVATITSEADAYAEEVVRQCTAAGLRTEIDLRNEKINYKVREHSLAKVPVMLVCGAKEAGSGSVSMRRLGSKNQEVLSLDDALARLGAEARPPDTAPRAN